MQIKILDRDFYKSASYLRCPQELNAQIYEATHGLASMLGCVDDLDLSDKCKKQIKKYKDYPQCKLWQGYERELLCYIAVHLDYWINGKKYNPGIINYYNYKILYNYFRWPFTLTIEIAQSMLEAVGWITDEVIQMHRSVLIQKEIEREKEIDNKIKDVWMFDNRNKYYKLLKQREKNYHYRNLWPDCPKDLKMRYDWRKNIQ